MDFKHWEAAHNERNTMDRLSHENVMQPIGYFEDHEYMLLIMNFMPYNLKTFMRSSQIQPKEVKIGQIKEIFYQMLLSV